MHYSIEKSTEENYIILLMIGNITRKNALKANIHAHSFGKKFNINKFFVDLRNCRNVDSISENYKFAYEDMQKTPQIDKSVAVAILVSPDDDSHDFFETLAINSGINARLFHDKNEALDFLIKETITLEKY